MKCKSSAPALIDLLRAGAATLLFVAGAHGQAVSPSGSRAPTASYVRFWNMLPGKGAVSYQLLTADDKVLSTAQPGNYVSSYATIPPGSYNFTVRKLNDAANALKKQPLLLRGDVYITYLVSEKSGQPAAELIDDTQDPKKLDDPSQVVIRQFIPGARVTVTTREGVASQEIGYGESTTLGNLAHQTVYLAMKATGLGGEAKTWSTEADLASYHHATLLIVADPYGRFRPRLVYDGQSVAALTAALKAAQSASPGTQP